MKNINWKVRIANKTFWIALIPALILLAQTIANVFGIQLDLTDIGDKILEVINAVFVLLTILGVVTDPTTKGVADSEQAMEYTKPK